MTTQLDANVKDDLKTQFVTREGTYRLLTLSEYSRPNRVGYSCNQNSPQVRVSIVTLPNGITGVNNVDTSTVSNLIQHQQQTSLNGNNNGAATTTGTLINGTADVSNLLNGQQQQQQQSYALMNVTTSGTTGMTSTLDARLGAGLSLQSIMNGSNIANGDNGLAGSPIYGGDRICFNFARELYVYAYRGVKKVSKVLSFLCSLLFCVPFSYVYLIMKYDDCLIGVAN